MKNLVTFSFTTILFFLTQAIHSQNVFPVQFAADADVKVYVATDSGSADIVVYQAYVAGEVNGNNGIWFNCQSPGEAQKRIFFVQSAAEADLVIYYADRAGLAGWRNPAKASLLN